MSKSRKSSILEPKCESCVVFWVGNAKVRYADSWSPAYTERFTSFSATNNNNDRCPKPQTMITSYPTVAGYGNVSIVLR
jgi:hypothetical protein